MASKPWVPRWRIYKSDGGWIIRDPSYKVPCLGRWYPTFEAARAAFAAGHK